jgi:multidrug efflux pump subunit AcrA (membrane-fusion protein)
MVYQSLRPLDVVIDVPEPLVIQSIYRKNEPPPTTVRHDSLPGVALPVEFREVSTEADPQTQTFQVTFSLEETGDYTVLPGMSVVLVAERVANGGTGIYILPPLAVTSSPEGAHEVWIYDPETGEVAPRSIEVGELRDDGLEVISGLSEGDKVVVAASHN